jgi:hypothetical protein
MPSRRLTRNRFPGVLEAKSFIVGEIAAEAARQQAPLSDLERKMLYFSETDETLDDIVDVMAAFSRAYDDEEYERRMRDLARAARSRGGARLDGAWADALDRLHEGDHYLSLLVEEVGRPPADWLRLIIAAVSVAALIVASRIVLARYVGHAPSADEEVPYLWAAAVAAALGYSAARAWWGADPVDRIFNRVLEWLLPGPKRPAP